MGIPKFFRWISERYPMTSQLITPNSIPTFDNLYLDMNGIIHNCSHPPSSENDVHFRITEEQMILAIFAYIDHLFTKIKPQKVFFMAIDGVAPRAKMNQQRSRRFRTARDAREMRREAERKGEKLPEEKAFDSNCITPGTPFMARLSDHLKYYVRKRISEDAEWRNVTVILSGHDVPGEGEHKIQEFIRLSKAQPDYNPNTRHCLYGLDADLIMLGLLSHDPHFCLLREEVTFGRKSKKSSGLANANFFLLHLSLLREYLDLEFSSLGPTLPFAYDLERIIDDFILMAVFVGNDFLPHLPDLHINEGALELIWGIYKEILPIAGGYLNEHGTIALPRLQLMLDHLANFERENFEKEFADQNWYKGRQEKEVAAMEKARKRGKLVITKDQQKLLNQVKKFVTKHQAKPSASDRLAVVDTLPARDRRFVQELADALHLRATWDETDDYGQPLVVLAFDMEGVSGGDEGDGAAGADDAEWEDAEDPEGDVAVQRVFEKYTKAKVVENIVDDFEDGYEKKMEEKLVAWKKQYYKEKLEINYDQPDELRQLVFRYIEGLQWVLNYYYKGVSSWGWFYNYHFAPKISDLRGIADFKFEFDMGKPFLPFQQLMGVLPEESKEHVPAAYRDLMYDEKSTILDFYPRDFELDMNGKKQDWEAVVKIPFIDEARLLRAMAARENQLTTEERSRNQGGILSTMFNYSEAESSTFPSSLPGFFPDIVANKARAEPFTLPALGDGIELILGLLDGVHLGAKALAGFPSMQTLPHHGALGYHGVNVFQSDSRNQSMVITLTGKHDRPAKGKAAAANGNGADGADGFGLDEDKDATAGKPKKAAAAAAGTAEVARRHIGQRAFHSWPYLQEGIVVAVSDETSKYELHQVGGKTRVVPAPLNPFQAIAWRKQADALEHWQSKRNGVITGPVEVVLHVRPLKGLKRLDTGALVKDYEGPDKELLLAQQLAVSQVTFEDERYQEQAAPPMAQEFPVGERVIFLGTGKYGTAAQVQGSTDTTLDLKISFFPVEANETRELARLVAHRPTNIYYPSHVLSRRVGVSALALARVTSSLMVALRDGSKTNVGLALKFDSKGMKVLGYSRKADRGWEFSEKTARLLDAYKRAFPEPFRNFDQRGGDIVTSQELCPTADDPDQTVKAMHKWLKKEGVLDLEPVTLFAEQLEKETVMLIEQFADHMRALKTPDALKTMTVRGVPRQAVLKPAHAIYRLQGQKFAVGDRVIMVQDAAAGGVPLGMKGAVVGLGARDVDVVWDVPFMGGETLSGRCSQYRGSTVSFASCLNLSNPQFGVNERSAPRAVGQNAAFKPTLGPRPVVAPNNYRPSVPAAQQPRGAGGAQPARAPAHGAPLQYGNAVKGVRAAPGAHHGAAGAHQPSQHDKLQSALLGQQRILAAAAGPAPHAPHAPVIHKATSPRAAVPPALHPAQHAPAGRGAPGGRGRGGRARGRGRGRGGVPAPAT